MSDNPDYLHSVPDWREALRRNERRTGFVILVYLLLYAGVGLLFDLFYWGMIYPGLPTSTLLNAFLTFKATPYVTLVMVAVAAVSVLVTFAFHDKLMLLGTQYRQVDVHSEVTEEKQLFNIVEELKLAAGLNYLPKIYIIEADYMNAFASGYSEKSALVAITRGLLNKLTRDEIQAVMAHELSHIRHHDIKLTLMASVLSNLMLMAIDLLFYQVLFSSQSRRENKLAIIIALVRFLLPIITFLLMLYLSRTREYMADAGCVELMRNNEPLGRALLKIHQDHKAGQSWQREAYLSQSHENVRRAAYLYDPTHANIRPGASLLTLFSTHPPLAKRLAALGIYQSEKDAY